MIDNQSNIPVKASYKDAKRIGGSHGGGRSSATRFRVSATATANATATK